jgi:hypothetical protein
VTRELIEIKLKPAFMAKNVQKHIKLIFIPGDESFGFQELSGFIESSGIDEIKACKMEASKLCNVGV